VAESCNGVSVQCPFDAKAPAMTTCAASQLGACMFSGPTACTGDQLETQWQCNGQGTCGSSMTLRQSTAACATLREATACAAPSYSACRYAATCSTSGDRDRTDSACASGTCVPHAPVVVANDVACARPTDGGTCGTGQRCSSGQCRCDATACGSAFGGAHGCCDGDTCRDGTASAFCGASGAACNACSNLECCGVSPTNPGGPYACRVVCL
jgi:hypothetical protein